MHRYICKQINGKSGTISQSFILYMYKYIIHMYIHITSMVLIFTVHFHPLSIKCYRSSIFPPKLLHPSAPTGYLPFPFNSEPLMPKRSSALLSFHLPKCNPHIIIYQKKKKKKEKTIENKKKFYIHTYKIRNDNNYFLLQ